MRFKITILFLIIGAALVSAVYFVTLNMVTKLEETLIANRLNADINYIEDLIGEGEWNIGDDGGIYLGDTLVGDGTHEKANLEPFLEHEEKTGTFSYVFIKCGDEGLGYVESTPTQKGYREGHFLRVAGSTRDPNGNSIVGTYMDVLVADVLDAEDTYGGEANVAGGMIYCRYNTLKDPDGEVVGAIVVGRNISELQSQVRAVMQTLITAIMAAVLLSMVSILFFITRWTGTISRITEHIRMIEGGTIPDTALKATRSGDELDTLITGVNRMTDTLRENEALRIKSETDQLTGLANRFGLNRYAEEFFENCYRDKQMLAVGIMDIDAFKPYNDHYGHTKGDACISAFANVLKAIGREEHVYCARFGGDEFVVIFAANSAERIEELAKLIARRVEEVHIIHEFSEISDIVTISQGYCYGVPEPHQRLNDYIHVADGALYDVKKETKNDYKIVQMTNEFRPSADQAGIR